MNKKGQLYGVIILFVGIIFALALIPAIFSSQSQMTTKQTTDNQSVDVTDAWIDASTVNESVEFTIYDQSDWKQSECPLTSVSLRNEGGDDLTETTDYVLDEDAGTFTLVDTVDTQDSNTTYVDYTYCADGYNTDSGSRSVATLIGLFSALALLGFVLSKLGVLDFFNR